MASSTSARRPEEREIGGLGVVLVKDADEVGEHFFRHEPHLQRGLRREPGTAAEGRDGIEGAWQIAQVIPDSKDLLQYVVQEARTLPS